jgi:hypothetical protein
MKILWLMVALHCSSAFSFTHVLEGKVESYNEKNFKFVSHDGTRILPVSLFPQGGPDHILPVLGKKIKLTIPAEYYPIKKD